MTSRERVNLIFKGENPDRPPFNFWMDRDIMQEYDNRFGENFRIARYDADVIESFALMDYFPDLKAEFVVDEKTSWLVKPKVEDFKEVFNFPVPDPNNPEIYQNIIDTRGQYPDKAIFAMMIAPLGAIGSLKLPEDFMMGLALEGDVVCDILDRIKPAMIEIAKNTCKLDIDVLYLAEDICMSTGLTYSKNMLRQFHFDYMKEIIDIAHNAGKKVFYHTDGLVIDCLELFMEYGIDGINPLEPRYNDPKLFIEKTQGKLMLYGGIDNCNIIPNGTTEEIKEHIKSQFEIIAKNTGMIFSSHDIPSHCPLENLDVMVDTIKGLRY